MNKKYFINVAMGTGANIALCSVLTQLKKEDPEYYFAVCSPYFDVFECCKAVNAVYKPQEMRDFIFDAKAMDAEIVNHRLYDMDGFIKKHLNYDTAWRMLLHVETISELDKPMDVTSELDTNKFNLKAIAEQIKSEIAKKGFNDFVIVQFSGGQSPLVQVPVVDGKQDWSKVPYDYQNEPLKRHYPIEKATEFLSLFHKEHPKTAVIAYQLPNEPTPAGDFIFKLTVPYLAYYELAKDALGVIAIDSSLQHLVAGITKAVVIWGHSEPKSFGYSYNKNIVQDCRRDDILYFSALGPSGAKIDYIKPETLLKEVDDYFGV